MVIQGRGPEPQLTQHPLGAEVTVNDPFPPELDEFALDGEAENEHSVVFC